MPRGGDPASPEDHLESGDSLSNWGSETGNGLPRESAGITYSVPNDDRRAERQRRMSASSSGGGPGPLAGASSRANRAAVTATSRTRDGSSAARGTADAREVSTYGGNQKPAKGGEANGASNNSSGAAGVDHDRPAWNASTKPTASKGRRLSQGEQQAHGSGGAGPASDEVCAGGGLVSSGVGRLLQSANRRKSKRSSLGSGEGGGGAMVGGGAADSPYLGDDAEGYGGRGSGDGSGGGGGAVAGDDVDDLDTAAPTQEEIRVMIERIKLQTAADDAAAVSGSQKVAKPGPARSDLEVRVR